MVVRVILSSNTITLRGMSSAHFCALQYVSRIINQELVNNEIGCEDEATACLHQKCALPSPLSAVVRHVLSGLKRQIVAE